MQFRSNFVPRESIDYVYAAAHMRLAVGSLLDTDRHLINFRQLRVECCRLSALWERLRARVCAWALLMIAPASNA